MSQQSSAGERFREAFDRLKNGRPQVLPVGTTVSQNNVAKEAGCDPTALKRSRFLPLIIEIQEYVKSHGHEVAASLVAATERKNAKRTLDEKLAEVTLQRDDAQSKLVSSDLRIMELTEKVQALQTRLAQYESPVHYLRDR